MIDLDSPVATVLGAQTKQGKAKKITDGLGLRTVGDLLHHFPRRYVRTGELTKVTDLRSGEMLTVVGEIVESEVNTYLDRRSRRTAYRLDTTLQTDGPSLRMSFFAKSKSVSEWHARRLSVGRRGVFIGQVSTFRNQWQLTNPTMVAVRQSRRRTTTDDETVGAAVASIKALFPLYPLTKGVDSWDLQRAIAFALTVIDDLPDPIPDGVRRDHRLPDLATALRHIHSPDSWPEVQAGPAPVPLRRGAGDPAGDGAPSRGAGRARRPGPARWRRAAGGVRRAAAVHPDRRARRRSRPRSWTTSPGPTR